MSTPNPESQQPQQESIIISLDTLVEQLVNTYLLGWSDSMDTMKKAQTSAVVDRKKIEEGFKTNLVAQMNLASKIEKVSKI